MAVTTELLTYEQYMAEPEINRRYEIIDGVRHFMTNPSIAHQKVLGRIYLRLMAWKDAGGPGEVIQAPCDILIRRSPLRTRQPDLLVISYERLGNRSLEDPAPLDPAAELVIEVLSPSNTPRELEDLLADYTRVNVQECWVVNRMMRTLEVLRLTAAGAESAAGYGMGQTVQSITFPGLTVTVADVFAP